MFYTKYRPQKFGELFGLENASKALLSQVVKGEVPHALFFFGPRGSGKTTTARLVAKALNCEKPLKSGEPCASCKTCKAVASGRFLDLIEIDAASNRGIDDIRDLREKVKLAPSGAKYKVYIIDEVHMLTTEAHNALLKTLEEPPKHAVFILATTDPQKVPATIKSRCQKFEFKRASSANLVSKLKVIGESEGKKLSESDLKLIASAAGGGYRDAETLLESVISGGISASEAVGLTAQSKVSEFVDMLVSNDTKGAVALTSEVYESGTELTVWTKELLEYLRKLMLVSVGLGEEMVDASSEQYEVLKSQVATLLRSGSFGGQVARWVEVFMRAYENLKIAAIPQLPLEVAVFEVCYASGVAARSQEAVGLGENQKSKIKNQNQTESSKTKVSKKAPSPDFSVEQVTANWDELLSAVRPYNHSLEAVLRSCFPAEVDDGELIIGVPFKFHKEKLEDAKNYKVVSKVLAEVLGGEVAYSAE